MIPHHRPTVKREKCEAVPKQLSSTPTERTGPLKVLNQTFRGPIRLTTFVFKQDPNHFSEITQKEIIRPVESEPNSSPQESLKTFIGA